MRERYARIHAKTALADAVVEAVAEDGPEAAVRAVREFAQERPTSSIVRLMFPEPS
jgi:hypothetical protein